MGLTIREYIVHTNNPKTKIVAEEYAVAVGQGFYWYSVALAECGLGEKNVLCFRDGMTLGRSIILQAANRAIDNSNGSMPFEQALLIALSEIFRPDSRR